MTRILLFFFFFSNGIANAVTLTQTASEVLIDLNTNTPTEAGSYFAANHESSLSSTLLSITDLPDSTKWTVYAKLISDIPGIQVQIQKTNNGLGNNPLTGKLFVYKNLISTTKRALFSGKGSRVNIALQTKIKGIGVGDGYGDFKTDIEFSVETLSN